MPSFDTLNALGEITKFELAKVVAALNNTGFVIDEDSLALGSMIIEHWTSECNRLLTDEGYLGGELASTGGFFPNCGAIHILYDTKWHSFEDAVVQLNNAAKKHPPP